MLSKRAIQIAALIFLRSLAVVRAETTDTNQIFYRRAEAAFHQAETNFSSATNFSVAALNLARASFDLADLATNQTQRAAVARRGSAVCRDWIAREPKTAAAHYYCAMNLGKLAEAEAPSLAAYKLVHEVEQEFKTAAELDVNFDHAGPARTLGLLYYQAPGWPLSIGSKRKANEWLERAAQLAPDYPENILNLAEAHLHWRQKSAATKDLQLLATNWPVARTNLNGTAHERDWQDWSARRVALLDEYKKIYKTAP